MQGLPEAEPSDEVFKYSCQARSRLESILELRLEGLGKLTGSKTFTHKLAIPANKQSALRNALQLVPQFGSVTDPSQPLRCVLLLLPMSPSQQSYSCHCVCIPQYYVVCMQEHCLFVLLLLHNRKVDVQSKQDSSWKA